MLKQIELWQKEEQAHTKSFTKDIDAQTKQIDVRMDKLVNAFLDGLIEKENYLKKKDQLLKEKSDLKLKNSDFDKNGKSWVEPLREWVKTLNQAEKMAYAINDLSEFKAFSEKVGSNRLLQDKKIGFDWLPQFDLLAKHKGLAAITTKSPDKAGLKKRGEKEELLYQRSLLDFGRTFFEQGQM